MKRTLSNAILAIAIASAPVALAKEQDCFKLSESVKRAVAAQPSNVLAIVSREVAASPGCSCEVVKAAIVACEAERKLVGQIVTAAIEAAPDNMRTITNCAIAVAPDALPEIQAVLAKLEPQGGGGYSAKGGYAKGGFAKGGEAGMAQAQQPGSQNPLDGPEFIPGLPWIHPADILDSVGIRFGPDGRTVLTPDSTCTAAQFPNINFVPAP